MTTYQKLKKENADLKHKLHILVTKPNSIEALLINREIKALSDFEEAIFFGDFTKPFSEAKGISDFISENTTKFKTNCTPADS